MNPELETLDLETTDPIPDDPRVEAILHTDQGLCPHCAAPLGHCPHSTPAPSSPFAVRAGRLESLLRKRRQRDLATGVAARQPLLWAANNLQRALTCSDSAAFASALALLDIIDGHLTDARRVLRAHNEKGAWE